MAKKNAFIKQKFGDRDFDSLTERSLRQMYREVPFDMFLVASNDEKIPVHYFAMILFSSYLRNKFKGELIFKPNIDVPLKKFSHEILKEIVQFIYFGETWINSNKTMEFIEVVQFLELLCTCSGPLGACIRYEEEIDDGLEGYVEFSRDAASIAIHEDEKMLWACEFPGCTSKMITKVVDGAVMIKRIQPLHSTECLKAQANHKSSTSQNKDNPDQGNLRYCAENFSRAQCLANRDTASDDVQLKIGPQIEKLMHGSDVRMKFAIQNVKTKKVKNATNENVNSKNIVLNSAANAELKKNEEKYYEDLLEMVRLMAEQNKGKILTSENGLAKEDGLSDWSSDISDSRSSENDDDSDLSEPWSTDDSTENNDEKFDQIKTNEYSVLSEDNSDSSLKALLSE